MTRRVAGLRAHRIPPCRRCAVEKGFTLVELLLVTAILAVLAALLVAVFGKAKDTAYRAQCASNLRQLGTAFHHYAADWNGWWPSPGGLVGDRAYWAQSGNGGLTAYVRQRGLKSVWCCPLLNEWHGRYPPRSYSMNSYLRDYPDMEFPGCISRLCGIHVDRIPSPAQTILLYEGIPRSREFEDKAYTEDEVYYIYRCANWTWVRGFYDGYKYTVRPGQPWHGRTSNYLYADCHVIARPPGRKTTGSYSTYDEMYEWYVDKGRFRVKFAGR